MKSIKTALLKIQSDAFIGALKPLRPAKIDDIGNMLISFDFKPATLIYRNEDWRIFSFMLEEPSNTIATLGLKWAWEITKFKPYIVLPLDIQREVYAAKLLQRTKETPEVLTLASALENNDDILKLPDVLI